MRTQLPRLARPLIITAAAMMLLLAAPAISSARVSVTRTADTLQLTGNGLNDRVVIGVGSINPGIRAFTVTPENGSGTVLTAGGACVQQTARVACPAEGITKLVADLGGGADRIKFSAEEADAEAAGLHATLGGGEGNDVLLGGSGIDTIDGGAGDDQMQGGGGADKLTGGDGVDLVSYEDKETGVSVSLDGVANDGDPAQVGTEGDNVDPSVERVVGGPGNDVLTGDDADNRLEGGLGNDTLTGNGGSDTLVGGDGDDVLQTRDDVRDDADCGAGSDRVTADSLDVTTNCETVELPEPGTPNRTPNENPNPNPTPNDTAKTETPPPGDNAPPVTGSGTTSQPATNPPAATPQRRGPALAFSKAARFDRKGRSRIRAICQPAISCSGTLRIVANGKVLARQKFAIEGDRRTPFALRLTKRGRKLLARKGVLKASMVGTVVDNAGAASKFRHRVTLRAPRTRNA